MVWVPLLLGASQLNAQPCALPATEIGVGKVAACHGPLSMLTSAALMYDVGSCAMPPNTVDAPGCAYCVPTAVALGLSLSIVIGSASEYASGPIGLVVGGP